MVELSHKVLGTVGAIKEQPVSMMSAIDIRSLIGLGCIKDEIVIGDFSFSLKSLSTEEKLELGKYLESDKEEKGLFEINMRMLSMSIESVNGKPFEYLHPKYSPESDVVDLKVNILKSMQPPVIHKLLLFYNEINNRCDAQFDMEQVKK